MEQILNKLQVHYTNNTINELIRNSGEKGQEYSLHYDHNENFYLQLQNSFEVPHFPIHHNFRESEPQEVYIQSLIRFLKNLIPLVPQIFTNLTYFFDPSEILRPTFFQVFKIHEHHFLYLLRLDLVYKTYAGKIIERGTNDQTPVYSTDRLFIDRDIIPLERVEIENGRIKSFLIKQMISETWIGETGRGYFVQGIWMDNELTKFFSKIVTPEGKRTYPYYPFTCKYRTICHPILAFDTEGRKNHCKALQQVINFLTPEIEDIQEALRYEEFSEDLECYKKLKSSVPSDWVSFWQNLSVKPYLNDQDMREFIIEF